MSLALPRSADLRRSWRLALAGTFALAIVIAVITAGNAVSGIGGSAAEKPIRDWLSSAVYVLAAAAVGLRAVCVPTRRLAWTMFAGGLSLYGLGNVLWSAWLEHLDSPPIPSICDGLWLIFYPLSYAGLVVLARDRAQPRLPAGVWLDGIVAGAGLAAIGAAVVFRPVLASASGTPGAVATELAYPIGDLLLAALVVGVLALRGWRVDRTWGALAGGFLLLALADCLYAVQVSAGSSTPSTMTNLSYMAAIVLLGCAAWQTEPEQRALRLDRWSVLLVPSAFTVGALGLLQYDHLRRLDPLAYGLAELTLLAAVARMALAFRDMRGLAEARRQAATDDLTALANRRVFMRRVSEAIQLVRLEGGEVSVLMMDLDNFKQLNDTLGHQAGDTLLRLIGPRLNAALRASDVVARLGGDEFAVLLCPQPDLNGVRQVARKILQALREPFEIEQLALRVTASMGIASFPTDAQDAHELMRHADIAMYHAKTTRHGYEFYASEHDSNSRERLTLATELAAALQHGRLEVHFQPKADSGTRRIEGVEALARWRNHGRHIPAHEFITAAEHAGLSRTLTRSVLNIALDQLQGWHSAGHNIHLAINTTVADLLDAGFPAEVAAALAARGLPPDALVLEVTESSVLADPERIKNILAQLGELGIQLSLDDFGTGYSSLAHLRSFPVGEVKIDRTFIARMRSDSTDAAIVYATIQLAHKLGIRVVAEGVEDEPTWQELTHLGCHLIQGYALSRPVPAAELTTSLTTNHAAHQNAPGSITNTR